MTETLIKIENLHKSFGKNEVLKGISLEIKRGEVVVIIGPSLRESILRTRRMTCLPCVRRWAWFSNNLTSFLI